MAWHKTYNPEVHGGYQRNIVQNFIAIYDKSKVNAKNVLTEAEVWELCFEWGAADIGEADLVTCELYFADENKNNWAVLCAMKDANEYRQQ